MVIGVLALQGAVEPHINMLNWLGVPSVRVKTKEHLQEIDGIILPGGESTTLLHLLRLNELWEPLREFGKQKPVWGVCAGTILLAKSVKNPSQPSLALLDIEVERNAYGRQQESFITDLESAPDWNEKPVTGVFIRSPRVSRLGKNVRCLLKCQSDPVMVEEGNLMASTFHPELTENPSVHQYFLKKCNISHA